jgi:hypothetical protein
MIVGASFWTREVEGLGLMEGEVLIMVRCKMAKRDTVQRALEEVRMGPGLVVQV